MDKDIVMSMLSQSIDDQSLKFNTAENKTYITGDFPSQTTSSSTSCWGYWTNDYYPYVIRESYPVYLQERAKDKGKQAFEIIKILKDKKLVKLETVANFIDLMDELIKIL